ncbi:hypothetical protein P9112_001952 [Eukaryota sp. TZLM1-RC]
MQSGSEHSESSDSSEDDALSGSDEEFQPSQNPSHAPKSSKKQKPQPNKVVSEDMSSIFSPTCCSFRQTITKKKLPNSYIRSLIDLTSSNQEQAALEILSNILQCCFLPTNISLNAELLATLFTSDDPTVFWEGKLSSFDPDDYPELKLPNSKATERLKLRFLDHLRSLILKSPAELFNSFYPRIIQSFIPLTGCKNQCFHIRLFSTAASLFIYEGICEYRARFKPSSTETETINHLDSLITLIFESVFSHRYKDSKPEIRSICQESLGRSILVHPQELLRPQFTKFFGWMLNDNAAMVRSSALSSLINIYISPHYELMEMFTGRFSERIVEMAQMDIEPDVRLRALELVRAAVTKSRDIFDPNHVIKICEMVNDEDVNIRSTAGDVFSIFYEISEEFHSQFDLKLLPILTKFTKLNIESESVAVSTSFLVDSLWDSCEMVKDVETMIDQLLTNQDLSEADQLLISSLLLSSFRRHFRYCCSFDPHAPLLDNGKLFFKPAKVPNYGGRGVGREEEKEKETVRDVLIGDLIDLLTKFRGRSPFIYLIYLVLFVEKADFVTPDAWNSAIDCILRSFSDTNLYSLVKASVFVLYQSNELNGSTLSLIFDSIFSYSSNNSLAYKKLKEVFICLDPETFNHDYIATIVDKLPLCESIDEFADLFSSIVFGFMLLVNKKNANEALKPETMELIINHLLEKLDSCHEDVFDSAKLFKILIGTVLAFFDLEIISQDLILKVCNLFIKTLGDWLINSSLPHQSDFDWLLKHFGNLIFKSSLGSLNNNTDFQQIIFRFLSFWMFKNETNSLIKSFYSTYLQNCNVTERANGELFALVSGQEFINTNHQSPYLLSQLGLCFVRTHSIAKEDKIAFNVVQGFAGRFAEGISSIGNYEEFLEYLRQQIGIFIALSKHYLRKLSKKDGGILLTKFNEFLLFAENNFPNEPIPLLSAELEESNPWFYLINFINEISSISSGNKRNSSLSKLVPPKTKKPRKQKEKKNKRKRRTGGDSVEEAHEASETEPNAQPQSSVTLVNEPVNKHPRMEEESEEEEEDFIGFAGRV